MRPARPPGLAKSLCDAPARVPCCHANAKRKRKRMLARAGAPRETRYRFSENGSRTDPFTVRVRGTGRYTSTGQCLTLPACCQLHTHCIPSQLTVVFHSRALFIIDHAHHALHGVVLHTEIKCNQNAGFYMPQVPGIGRMPWTSPEQSWMHDSDSAFVIDLPLVLGESTQVLQRCFCGYFSILVQCPHTAPLAALQAFDERPPPCEKSDQWSARSSLVSKTRGSVFCQSPHVPPSATHGKRFIAT